MTDYKSEVNNTEVHERQTNIDALYQTKSTLHGKANTHLSFVTVW